ncbi:MAG TPA: hypothetical protein VH325_12890 [Bryobacteraceae bacterium]|jgi:uncharacterized protein HemY|nr:hypothetical protein [Bryobacteraceae bacterium]
MTTQILESLRLTEQAIELSAAERDALEQHRRKLQANLARTLGKQALQSRQWEEAADHFIQVQQYAPSGKTRLVVMLLKLCPRLLYSFFSWRERRHHTRFALEHS